MLFILLIVGDVVARAMNLLRVKTKPVGFRHREVPHLWNAEFT